MTSPSETFFTPTIIAGVIIGISALTSVLLARILESWRRDNMITGVLRALEEELIVIRAQLNSKILKDFWNEFEDKKKFWDKFKDKKKFWEEWKNSKDEDKAVVPFYFPTSVNFSIIYRSNTNLIGEIENSDLRRELVWNYAFLRILVECYEKNNRLFDEYKKAEINGEKESKDMFLYELYLLAPTIKENHDTVNGSMGNLMEILKKEIDRRTAHKFWLQ